MGRVAEALRPRDYGLPEKKEDPAKKTSAAVTPKLKQAQSGGLDQKQLASGEKPDDPE